MSAVGAGVVKVQADTSVVRRPTGGVGDHTVVAQPVSIERLASSGGGKEKVFPTYVLPSSSEKHISAAHVVALPNRSMASPRLHSNCFPHSPLRRV